MAKKKDIALTHQQEMACIALVMHGLDQAKAYVKAYPHAGKWKRTSVYAKASHLFAMDKVRLRVDELRTQLANKALVEEAPLLKEVALQATARVDRIYGTDGEILPLEDWPEAERAALVSIQYKFVPELFTTGDYIGQKTGKMLRVISKVVLDKKGPAQEKLMKHLGLYERDNQQKGAADTSQLFDEVGETVLEKLEDKLSELIGDRTGPEHPGEADAPAGGRVTH